MTDIGETLPKVSVKDSAGNAVALADLNGPFVLYYYPKADTPGCTNEAKDFTALAAEFRKAGVTVYGMSKDTPAKLAKFADKYGLSVSLLSDEESDATEQMGVWVEKSLYGKKYMGIERCTFLIGKDGKVARVWRKVKVKGHAEEVLAAVQGL
ncbi:MAG: thioredoxin-dependent thiol peroxidase [Sphingomonadales bacterium]|jgi:peroxiredoxin Q/BCP|nr:thioredoxin-dependent thiol peroxidase [Sphingomonadales bacterium]